MSVIARRTAWLRTASHTVERSQGVPGFLLVPAVLGGAALIIAVVGLFWDVAWHIDHGRDVNLLTPPHVLILVGLMGLGFTAVTAIALATAEGRGGWRVGPLRVPLFAAPLLAMAAGAAAGFPLDDLWHRTYGIDVTLWSPTHLLMIGGAVFSTFALALIPGEARLHGRGRLPSWRRIALAGAPVVGLSVFTLEYDFAVPQWQALYHPLLVMVGLTLTLSAARWSLGRGGAFLASLFFLGLRVGLALFLGLLGHTWPAFPIALGVAACVEAGAWIGGRRGVLTAALVTGALAATAGLATEWAWQDAIGRLPWTPQLASMLWVPVLGALLAAVVGTALGRMEAAEPLRMPPALVVAGVLGLLALMAVPFPRTAPPLAAQVTTSAAGAPRQVVNRFGVPATEQDVNVDVTVDRPGAVHGADWFYISAWQGGGERAVPMREVAPGRYRALTAVPTGASWKTMVFLARGDALEAVPVAFPPDPDSHFAGYPLEPVRDARFVPASDLLMVEAHGGSPWVANVAYVALGVTVAVWIGLLLLAHRAVSLRRGSMEA